MKNILFGLIGVIALALPAQAQGVNPTPVYTPIPDSECPEVVHRYTCFEEIDGKRMIWVIPSRQDANYILTVQPIGPHNFVVLVDRQEREPISYMLYDDDASMIIEYRGRQSFGGDLGFFREFLPEVLNLVQSVPW